MNYIIKNTKYKLDNNIYTAIYSKNREIFNKLQELFLSNGYSWNGLNKNVTIPSLYDHYINNEVIFEINYHPSTKKILTISIDVCYKKEQSVILDENNIDYFIKNLFIIIPNYNSKKIDRTI